VLCIIELGLGLAPVQPNRIQSVAFNNAQLNGAFKQNGSPGLSTRLTSFPGHGNMDHEVCLGANVRINAFTVWRVFQAAMPRLHATSTAKSISGAMTTPQFHLPLFPACQRRRPVSPDRVPRAQLAVLINHPAQ
jgi:hypothetical protein